MSTNYVVSGHGDLSTIFKPLTTYPSLSYDTSYSVAGATGAVDLRYKFRPCTAAPESKIAYNTNYSVNGIDLKDIFMDISYNPFIVTASGEFTGTNPIIFTGTGSFIVTFDSPVDISYAVVGGGGGGGGSAGIGSSPNMGGAGSGGGGGGLSYYHFTPTSGHVYNVSVGAGGNDGAGGGPDANGHDGNNGSNSSISDISNAIATGGGGGQGGPLGDRNYQIAGYAGTGTAFGSFSGGEGGWGNYGELISTGATYPGTAGNSADGNGSVLYGTSQTLSWGGGGGGGGSDNNASAGGLASGGIGGADGTGGVGNIYGGGGGGGASPNFTFGVLNGGWGGGVGAPGVVIIWWTPPTTTPSPSPSSLETIPGKPTIISVNPGNSQISLTWTAPTDTGGSPITHYMITYSTNSSWTTSRGIKQIGTSTSTTITGLTNGQTYYFRVYSINSIGTSTTYDSSGGFIPVTNPSVPRNFIATPGNGEALLSWLPPTDNGGFSIINYMITYTDAASGLTQRRYPSATDVSFNITGLTNGQSYTFNIIAKNSRGLSSTDASANATPVLPVIPAIPIPIPTITNTIPGNGQVLLSWSVPENIGGSITDYNIEYKSHNEQTWLTFIHTEHIVTITTIPINIIPPPPPSYEASISVIGLTNGQLYDFKVAAITSVGTGSYSTSVQATPMTTPTAPRNVVTTAGNGQVLVAWSAPTDNGGSTIINYIVEYKNDTEPTWHTTDPIVPQLPSYGASISVIGLTNGQLYDFKVAAINSMGTGSYSTSVQTTPFIPSKPTAPTITNVNVNITNSHLVLTWTPPANTGGTITGYTLSNTNLSGEGFRYLSGNSVSPLSISSIYYPINISNTFKLCAINASGSGPYSNSFTYNP
jgi:hypothetical protein